MENEYPRQVGPFGILRRIIRRYPFTIMLTFTVYFVTVITIVYGINWIDLIRGYPRVSELEARIAILTNSLEEKDAIVSRLSKNRRGTLFFRKLSFDEMWKNDEARVSIMRLLEYADFALTKDDYRHADRLYEEANQIQNTISVAYYKGRLEYIKGNPAGAIENWETAIKIDSMKRYTEIQLYLGIVFYELGDDNKAIEYISAYLRGR